MPFNLVFYKFCRWYYFNYQQLARRFVPSAVGAVGLYVLIPAQVGLAMAFWATGNLQILGVNVFAYNEILERQT